MTKKTAAVPAKVNDGWKGYVNWSPMADDRDKVLSLMGKDDYDPGEYLLQLGEAGYTTSFSYDEANSCHRVSFTGKGKHCPNQGYTLSIRASSPGCCLGLGVYYIFILCESGDWLVDKAGAEVW